MYDFQNTKLHFEIESKLNCVAQSAKEVASKDSISKTAEPAKNDSIKAIAEQPKSLIEAEGEVTEKATKPTSNDDGGKRLSHKISESEFVSDDFQTTCESDLAEIQDGMRKLGIDSMTQQALATTDGKSCLSLVFLILSSY